MQDIAEHVADRFPSTQDERAPFSVRLVAVPEHDPDTAVLSVQGEVDLTTAPLLREAMLPVLAGQQGLIVVDLSEVRFMDSSGIHVLVEALQRLGSENRRLAIACREYGRIHELLALVGLLDTVTVYRSRDDALIGGEDRIRPDPSARRPRRRFANERATRGSAQPALGARRG